MNIFKSRHPFNIPIFGNLRNRRNTDIIPKEYQRQNDRIFKLKKNSTRPCTIITILNFYVFPLLNSNKWLKDLSKNPSLLCFTTHF